MRNEAFFLLQKISNAEYECDRAIAQIRHATTLSAVVQAMQVHTDAMVQCMPQVRAARQRVEQAAADRANQLLAVQLKALADKKDRNAFDALLSGFRREWEVLRGHLPQAYRLATGQAAKLRPTFGLQ